MTETNYKVGDKILGKDRYKYPHKEEWFSYVYEVLQVSVENRFGKPTQLLKVKESTTDGDFVEITTRWANQLF